MRQIWLQFGGEMILIKVDGNKIEFGNTLYGAMMTSIKGLKLNKPGVEKEHPDLKGNPLWREEAIDRFLSHVRGLKSEKSISLYLIKDLKKYGYIPKRIQINGHRPERI